MFSVRSLCSLKAGGDRVGWKTRQAKGGGTPESFHCFVEETCLRLAAMNPTNRVAQSSAAWNFESSLSLKVLFLLDIASGKLWWGLTCWRRAFHLWRTVDIYSLGCNSAKKCLGCALSYHSHSPQWMGWFCTNLSAVCSDWFHVFLLPLAFWTSVCNIIEWLGFSSVVEGLFEMKVEREGDEMRAKVIATSSLLYHQRLTLMKGLKEFGWGSQSKYQYWFGTLLLPDLVQRTSHKVTP